MPYHRPLPFGISRMALITALFPLAGSAALIYSGVQNLSVSWENPPPTFPNPAPPTANQTMDVDLNGDSIKDLRFGGGSGEFFGTTSSSPTVEGLGGGLAFLRRAAGLGRDRRISTPR